MNTILQRGYAYESVKEVGYNLMFWKFLNTSISFTICQLRVEEQTNPLSAESWHNSLKE